MLSKVEWILAENGDDCIAYSEFECTIRALIGCYNSFIFSIFVYYICFLTFKWYTATKIILGIVNLINLPSIFLIPVALIGMFTIKNIKNKWLIETQYVNIHSTFVSSIGIFCYIWFVFFEHPLPNFLDNIFAFMIITIFLFWFRNNLIIYKNTDIPETWLIKNGFKQKMEQNLTKQN